MDRFIRIQIYTADESAVAYDNKTNTSWGITAGTMQFDSQIVDTELRFGQMYASCFEVQIFGLNTNLIGRKIVVSAEYEAMENSYLLDDAGNKITDDDGNYIVTKTNVAHDEPIFTGYIESTTLDAYSHDRNIVAYDIIYWKRDLDVSDWWQTYWANRTTSKLVDLRTALLTEVGLTYVSKSLPNDTSYITKPELGDNVVIKFGDILPCICELQGCFPHINGSGSLEFITLPSGAGRDISENLEGAECRWESYYTKAITGVSLYNTNDQIMAEYISSDGNIYNVTGNILLVSSTTNQLTYIATMLYMAISSINFSYKPCSLKCIVSDLSYKLGDKIITGRSGTNPAYILNLSMYGSQLIEQEIVCPADGETLSQSKRSYNQELIQGNKYSEFNQALDAINLVVGETSTMTFPTIDSDYCEDGTGALSDYVIINISNAPYQLFGDKYSATDFKFGVKMDYDMTASQLAKPKAIRWTTDSPVQTYAAPIYIGKDANNNDIPLTDTIDTHSVMYLSFSRDNTAQTVRADLITESYSKAEINMVNNQIVLKVDSNGDIVEVALGSSPSTGSTFSVKAQNIEFISGNKIELTTNNLEINSTNFTVDSDGNVVAKNFTVTPSLRTNGAFRIQDSFDNYLGNWGGSYVFSGVTYVDANKHEVSYNVSSCDFAARNVFSDGSGYGGISGGFTESLEFNQHILKVQLLTNPFAINESDRTAVLKIGGSISGGPIDIQNSSGWGLNFDYNYSLNSSLRCMIDLVKAKSFQLNCSAMTNGMALGSYVSLDSGYKFLCWVSVGISDGWVEEMPIYVTPTTSNNGSVWWSTNGNFPTGSSTMKVTFTYLEIRNL